MTIQAELTAAMRIINKGLAKGYTVSVNDGEEWTVKRSRDANQVRGALQSTDSDIIRFRDATGASVGTIWFVWGNSPDEVAADWSDLPAINELMQ